MSYVFNRLPAICRAFICCGYRLNEFALSNPNTFYSYLPSP